MAAEKLTKARLVQIVVIFIILVIAFTWRTIEHGKDSNMKITCKIGEICLFKDSETTHSMLFNQVSPSELKITLQPIKNTKENESEIINSIWISSRTLKVDRMHLTTSQELRLSILKLNPMNQFDIETHSDEVISLTLVP
ncbi:hypothetical protein [Vibrio rumoiensis]|uniref:Uncharacterized protein n=1 Tax=Vibrio rumoiensis 1S-45 TaxID=1188252 RepID=A0A1E5E6U5_9VIBR|nr:hypothetical protein [Vibrio rumoiensis]OEF30184.1 hypothetical protein A1QC_00490 [Vibrio rumoiensis 1S-45]